MDLPKMRQVVAIHRHGSFAKAADALGMSQPSLSRSISRLEDELKLKIFERSAVGSELTPAGEVVLERLERVIADTESLMRDATLIAGGEGGLVRVGVSTALRGRFLEAFVVEVAAAHPKLRVHTEVNGRAALLPLLASRDLDVIITLSGGAIDDPRLVVTKLLDLEMAAVACPSHPLVGAGPISFEQFTRHRHSGPPAALTLDFFGLSSNNLAPYYTANDYEAITPLVLAGLTTLVAPLFVVRPLIDEGRLARIDVALDLDLDLVAVCTRASASAPIIRHIIGHARQVLAGLGLKPALAGAEA
jgi:DNA-binding transcriptional LysR family regulator